MQSARNRYLKRAREADLSALSPETERLSRSADEAIRDHLAPDDVAGALKEKRGAKILKSNGKPFNHGQEVIEARRAVRNTMDAIHKRMLKFVGDPAPAAVAELDALQSKLSELSLLLNPYPRLKK